MFGGTKKWATRATKELNNTKVERILKVRTEKSVF